MGVGASALQHKEPASWPGRPALPWALSAQDSSAPSLTFPVRSGSPTQDTPFAQLQAAPVSWLSDYFPPIKPIMVYMQKKKKTITSMTNGRAHGGAEMQRGERGVTNAATISQRRQRERCGSLEVTEARSFLNKGLTLRVCRS